MFGVPPPTLVIHDPPAEFAQRWLKRFLRRHGVLDRKRYLDLYHLHNLLEYGAEIDPDFLRELELTALEQIDVDTRHRYICAVLSASRTHSQEQKEQA